jgi:hypothetical protein
VELLERLASGTEAQARPSFPGAACSEPDFWVGAIVGAAMATPEQIVESVIAKRYVLGAGFAGGPQAGVRADDWVCFFVPGKGVVGHGQVASVLEDCADLTRESNRFSRLLRLKNVELYDTPVPMDVVTELHLTTGLQDLGAAGPVLAPLTRQEFLKCTSLSDESEHKVGADMGGAAR